MTNTRSLPLLGVLGGMGPLAAADFLTKLVAETPAMRDQDHIPYVAWVCRRYPNARPRSSMVVNHRCRRCYKASRR